MVSFAAWMGSTLWVTFIAGITMFRNMPRQIFGKVQVRGFVCVRHNALNGCPATKQLLVSSGVSRGEIEFDHFVSVVDRLRMVFLV